MCWYWYNSLDGARPDHRQTVWVDILWMCDASPTHCNGTQLAPQGSQTLYCLFPPPVISPSLILSSLFFLQQSITTMPGERRSCRCRLETQCTYLRHMKVRTGSLMTHVIRDDTPMSGIILLSSLVPLLLCQIFVHVFNKIHILAIMITMVCSCKCRR